MKPKKRYKAAPIKRAPGISAEHLDKLHATAWAALTFTSFIVVYILAIMLGAWGIMPFVYGALALLSTLLLEALLRGRLWPFEPGFRESFGHPEISYRLLFFCSAFLLILETAIIVGNIISTH